MYNDGLEWFVRCVAFGPCGIIPLGERQHGCFGSALVGGQSWDDPSVRSVSPDGLDGAL